MRATPILGLLSVLVVSGAIAWDLANEEWWRSQLPERPSTAESLRT